MNNRDILKRGDHLSLQHYGGAAGAGHEFEILGVTGEGGSAVCYEAKRGNISGRLKEFSPIGAWGDPLSEVKLCRESESGRLFCKEGADVFRKQCEEYIRPYRLLSEIRGGDAMPCGVSVKTLNNYMPVFELMCSPSGSGTDFGSVYIWTPGDREGIEFGEWLTRIRTAVLDECGCAQRTLIDSLEVILKAVYSLSDCICVLHMCGLLHLDIKPSNFLMASDSRGKAIARHISLFDVNSLYDMDSDIHPALIGTEGYMAPELRHGRADPRADIYSIGALLYKALTLALGPGVYYHDEDYSSISRTVRDSFLIRQLEIPGQAYLADALSGILRKCLAYDCSRRYRNCEELKAAIEKALTYLQKRNAAGSQVRGEETNSTGTMQILLTDYPLYRCLNSEEEELSVIIAGDGTWSRRFLDMVLTVGQNLRNPLSVTVYANDADNALYRYRSSRPALGDFVEINGKNTGKANDVYGCLRYRELPDKKRMPVVLNRRHPAYMFISLETDRESFELAGQMISDHCVTACVYQGDGTVDARQLDAAGAKGIAVCRVLETVKPRRSLEKMAFNIFLAWKGDSRGSIRDERKHFREKYQYNASMANALSIQYKLYMLQTAGLLKKTRSRAETAKAFRELLCDSSFAPMLDELALREHRRWVMDKVADGWRSPGEALSAIYYKDVERTGEVRIRSHKIHPCVVHSEKGLFLESMTRGEWDTEDYFPQKIDDLDLVSLMLHRALRKADSHSADRIYDSNHGLYCDYKKVDYDLIEAIPDILTSDPARDYGVPSYTPAPLDTTDVVLPTELTELMECLAANAHDTWAKARIAEGWHYGKKKSELLRTTPDLVPYDMLPESEKRYDRDTVIGTLKSIIKLGYRIER